MSLQNHVDSIVTTLIVLNSIFNPKSPKKEYTSYALEMNNQMQGKHMTVGATAYYGDPITYTGTVPKVGRTIAVDPKVIPYGTRVYIPQFNKIFIAEDCGSKIKGNRIDIFMNTYDECMKWGFRDIEIILLDQE